jgi:hypothetical protein
MGEPLAAPIERRRSPLRRLAHDEGRLLRTDRRLQTRIHRIPPCSRPLASIRYIQQVANAQSAVETTI